MEKTKYFIVAILLTLIILYGANDVFATRSPQAVVIGIFASFGPMAIDFYDKSPNGYQDLCPSKWLSETESNMNFSTYYTPFICYSNQQHFCIQAIGQSPISDVCIDDLKLWADSLAFCDNINYDCKKNDGENYQLQETYRAQLLRIKIKNQATEIIKYLVVLIFVLAGVVLTKKAFKDKPYWLKGGRIGLYVGVIFTAPILVGSIFSNYFPCDHSESFLCFILSLLFLPLLSWGQFTSFLGDTNVAFIIFILSYIYLFFAVGCLIQFCWRKIRKK